MFPRANRAILQAQRIQHECRGQQSRPDPQKSPLCVRLLEGGSAMPSVQSSPRPGGFNSDDHVHRRNGQHHRKELPHNPVTCDRRLRVRLQQQRRQRAAVTRKQQHSLPIDFLHVQPERHRLLQTIATGAVISEHDRNITQHGLHTHRLLLARHLRGHRRRVQPGVAHAAGAEPAPPHDRDLVPAAPDL